MAIYPAVEFIFGMVETIFDIVDAINAALGTSVSPEYFDMPEEMVATYQHYTCADLSQTQQGLGWSPNWSPTDAMVEYIKLISSERSNARVMPTA